ncbi:TolB-like 6-bladed beta-propeller domain-containing protein [Terrimonas sp. NA20]|uniref:TolB-like 6-bladed beta-propeller domain-containing protein n=1 Tax=Terrimonas ginsenosidimutans TaxID=2908004 RepID=A0ABS9KP04_9BACT|nr:BF3164 family lipoprotein [Terrimonas ginsenosidimutans]MCG2614058.1 TolB-like 6-bladed beta-propeller domain-containing protein [Terrimonas ginsenosidimutans]
MKRSFCFCVLLTLGNFAMAQDSSVVSTFTRFPEEMHLDLQPVFGLGKVAARNIFLVDSTFYIRNKNGSSAYYLTGYSAKGKKTGKEYIRQGMEVNEVAGAMSSGFLGGSRMWVHDILTNKIVIAAGFDRTPVDGNIRVHEHKLPLDFYWVGMIDSGYVAGTGVDDQPDKVYELELSTGKVVKRYGSYGTAPAEIPFNSWRLAYQSFLYTRPGGDVIALACRFTDRVEFFDREKETSRIISGPENFDVVFRPIKTGNIWAMERIDSTRFAFVNGFATQQYLYLLYAGHLHEDRLSDNGRCLYVYDWKGNPVRKITLSAYISSFMITQDGRYLYGYSPTGHMLRGELP